MVKGRLKDLDDNLAKIPDRLRDSQRDVTKKVWENSFYDDLLSHMNEKMVSATNNTKRQKGTTYTVKHDIAMVDVFNHIRNLQGVLICLHKSSPKPHQQ